LTGLSDRARLHIRATLGLTDPELEDLLSAAGPDAVSWFSDILEKKLIPERIPAVIRRPDAELAGRTLLDLLRGEGMEGVRDYFDRLFSYIPE